MLGHAQSIRNDIVWQFTSRATINAFVFWLTAAATKSKEQPVRSEAEADCLASAILTFITKWRCRPFARFVSGRLLGQRGEMVKGRFLPPFLRVSRVYDYLSISLRRAGHLTQDLTEDANQRRLHLVVGWGVCDRDILNRHPTALLLLLCQANDVNHRGITNNPSQEDLTFCHSNGMPSPIRPKDIAPT